MPKPYYFDFYEHIQIKIKYCTFKIQKQEKNTDKLIAVGQYYEIHKKKKN